MDQPTQKDIASQEPNHPQAVVVHVPDHEDLGSVWPSAVRLAPGIFPSRLPKHVLIKPNLCDIVGWENGVTTDPRWISVLSQQLRAIRPDVNITIVESDAVSAYKSIRSCNETYLRLGYLDAAKSAGVEILNLSEMATIELSAPSIPLPIRMPQILLGEFFFVSIANLKSHIYERMTGILKNSLGLPSESDISGFHPYLPQFISWLHGFCPPDLCIIDGRIGLEGDGPIMGDPIRMDRVIFSNDAIAADVTACRLMGVLPEEVPHLVQTCKDWGRSTTDVLSVGDAQPRKFHFDENQNHKVIRLKFASRRALRSLEFSISVWISRLVRMKREPVAFLKGALRRLGG